MTIKIWLNTFFITKIQICCLNNHHPIAYFCVQLRAVASYLARSVLYMWAISGTRGSSGFGSVSNEQIESNTWFASKFYYIPILTMKMIHFKWRGSFSKIKSHKFLSWHEWQSQKTKTWNRNLLNPFLIPTKNLIVDTLHEKRYSHYWSNILNSWRKYICSQRKIKAGRITMGVFKNKQCYLAQVFYNTLWGACVCMWACHFQVKE